MKIRKILCSAFPILGHIIPVLTIAKHLSKSMDVTFVIDKEKEHFIKKYGIKCIQPYKSKSYEEKTFKLIKLISRKKPDIVISDFNKPFHFASRSQKLNVLFQF